MYRKLFYLASLTVALSLTSCGKKLGQFSADYFTVNPNPLEVVGEKVPARVSARIPAKFFVKNAEVTVTPTLVFNGQEVSSQSYSFQGEKVRGNNPVISYEYGGTATIPVDFAYNPDMAQSDLMLNFAVTQGNKRYVLPAVKVANGVVATAAMADVKSVTPAIGADAFQRIINEKYAADIMFLVNQANIRASQLSTDAIKELQREILEANGDTSRRLQEINISSYASPEGGVAFNTRLAQQREENTRSYMERQLNRDNERKLAIYDKAARLFPNDYRTFNNLGMAQYVAGDYSAAQANFSRAASMGNHPEPQMNLGLIEMLNGNYNKANQYFGSAAGVDELGNALGVYYLKQGDAAAAVNAFGSSRTNNAALAQILARDYSRAKTTLASVETPDATTYYLMAILGARTNNEKMVTTNLRQAIRLDKSLASRAASDLEFANFNLSSALN